MSLRDTIEGAREEAKEASQGLPKRGKKDEASVEEDEKRGFSKSSAAKARPAREAASSVRVATKPSEKARLGTETKEEKRERRRKEREEEDLRNRAYDLIMRSMPGYKQVEVRFWVFLGVGLVLAVISIISANVVGGFAEQTDFSSAQGIVSIVALVAAYACIIGGFIYDLRKRRPFRREAEARVKGLSDKKLAEIFEKAREEQAKKDADKKAAKEAKAKK